MQAKLSPGRDVVDARGRAVAIGIVVDGPPRVGPGQLFAVETIASGSGHGQVRRHRNIGEHPLTLAYESGKISADEHNAGNTYRVLFEKMGRTGKDSTDFEVSGSPAGTPFTQTQVEAIQAIKKIEAAMDRRNAAIVRKFCGEGLSMKEAVMRSTACHGDGVLYRLREALENLGDAITRGLR